MRDLTIYDGDFSNFKKHVETLENVLENFNPVLREVDTTYKITIDNNELYPRLNACVNAYHSGLSQHVLFVVNLNDGTLTNSINCYNIQDLSLIDSYEQNTLEHDINNYVYKVLENYCEFCAKLDIRRGNYQTV
jgi:hypothetical protein